MDLMEMMLAGVKCALTVQPFRMPQEVRNTAAAQEVVGWIHLFKGRIYKQWIERQRDYIGDKATEKNDALNWETTVIDYFFTKFFKFLGPEKSGPSWARSPRTCQQIERCGALRDHSHVHIQGSSP